jgi:hypothetical protein
MLRIKKYQKSVEEYPIQSMITAAESAVLSTATVEKDNVLMARSSPPSSRHLSLVRK